ncbi:hypothetical protein WJX72_009095 [[Myrmecia] bisecta]|uniref:Exocyst complex component Sec8 n=1 Tax=[Myrmecia] bisecta TaxID=41462 RepID=A0AAW1QS82_9CHLO
MAGPETFSWWKGSRVAAEPSTTDTASSNRTSERIAAHHGGATADRKALQLGGSTQALFQPGAQEPGKGTAFPLMASAASGGGTAAPPPDSPAQGLLEHIEALIGRQLYFQAIDAYLQLDTPAMHWEQDFQGKGLPQTPTTIPQGYRHLRLELLDWCMQSLQRLQDARTSAVEVSSLQEQAAGARDAAVLEQGAVWQTSFDTDPKNQLSGAIWHLSETREEAWNNLVAVFRDEAVMAADPRQFNQQGVQQVSVAGILRLASRRHSIPPRLTHRPSQDGKSRHRQALPADAVDTSKPYVQAVGDRLLKSARQQLPLMRGLAEDVPKDVITRLYGGPLATAVRKHLEWQLAHKPASAAAKLEDNVVRRSKCFPFPFPLWTTSAKQETDQAASDEEPGIVAAHLVLAVGEAHQAVISFLQELHELMIQLGCSSDANYEGAVDTDWDGIVYETVIKAFRSMQDPFHSEIASCLQAFVSTILQHVPAEQARQASIGPGTISRAKFLGSVTTDKASFAQMGIPSDTHKRMSDITRSDGPASRNNREVSHTPMSRPSLEAAAKRSMEITRNRSKSLDVASQALLDGPTTS